MSKLSLVFFSMTAAGACMLPVMSTPFALGAAFMLTMASLVCYMVSVGPLWYPLVLFLVYAGAILVLFAYMVCLTPNQKILPPPFKKAALLAALIFVLALVFADCHFTPIHATLDSEAAEMAIRQAQSPSSLARFQNGNLLIFCALSLFITLVSVVKICKYQRGPLRPFIRKPKKQSKDYPDSISKTRSI